MPPNPDQNLNYDDPIEIAQGVYWVGYSEKPFGLHCNPYLIVDGDEAVVIDAGSRADFPYVMLKILRSPIAPSAIRALVFHHSDPDLCGSIANIEDLIGRDDMAIISEQSNHSFIRHYSISSQLVSLESIHHQFVFSSGRTLEFVRIPYAHTQGSFISLDSKTGVLFSSDLFGSYSTLWKLFSDLAPTCKECMNYRDCPAGRTYCPLPDILAFHRQIMPSERALKFALEQVLRLPFKMIAPQHGSIIHKTEDIVLITERLLSLKDVGIDAIVEQGYESLPCDINPLKERFKRNEN